VEETKECQGGAEIMSASLSVDSSIPRLQDVLVRQISIADREEIKPGTIFIERHTRLPLSLEVESKRFSRDWQVLHGANASAIEKHLRDIGWSFSFVVPAVTASACGASSKSRVRTAVNRALQKIRELGLNAMEVGSLEVRSLAGLIYVKLLAYPRQVSDSVFLYPFDASKRSPRLWGPQTFDPYRDLRRKLSLTKYPGMSGR
jgi:hypothetical protein